jgi:hypothetical protein
VPSRKGMIVRAPWGVLPYRGAPSLEQPTHHAGCSAGSDASQRCYRPVRVLMGWKVRRRLDYARQAPFSRLEISFSQGGEWRALISKYIGVIPLSSDVCSAAEQKISG